MSVDITIPSPGESITEVTVGTWMKQSGDWVDKDDILLEIESDKATLEITSPAAGLLTATGATGDELAVGEVIGAIDTSATKPAASAPTAETTTAAETPASTDAGDVKATPVARKIAADEGVNLTSIKGTGPSGRITKADVLAAAAAAASSAPAAAAEAAAPAAAPAATPEAPVVIPTSNAVPGSREVRRVRMTKLRRRIADRLVESQRTAATLTRSTKST